MKFSEISKVRLSNQQIAESKFSRPREVVSWMGAIQAQDYIMAKWAIGVRLNNCTNHTIEKSIDKGEILRTHILRPTWHFVSSEDIYWMLELTAPQIKSLLPSRHRQLELNSCVLKKTNKLIEKALDTGKYLSREELFSILEKERISTKNSRGLHILLWAELNGIICSGPTKGNRQTYALLSERVPNKKTYKREESLAMLALRYFTSHGPATLKDFIWWSGLSVTDAKRALEEIKTNLISEKINLNEYWFTDSSIYKKNNGEIFLLPAFDEFIISYKDRSPSLVSESQSKMISSNGLFRPIVVHDGQVIGIWKRTVKKNKSIIETNLFSSKFSKANKIFSRRLKETVLEYRNFLDQEIEIKNNQSDFQ